MAILKSFFRDNCNNVIVVTTYEQFSYSFVAFVVLYSGKGQGTEII